MQRRRRSPVDSSPATAVEVLAPCCAVCFESFAEVPSEHPVRRLRCGHVFCEECIGGWWKEAQNNSCPVCRQCFASIRNCERTTAGTFLGRGQPVALPRREEPVLAVKPPRAAARKRSRPRPGVVLEALQWAQCEACDTWRVLPEHVQAADLPEHFVCAMSAQWIREGQFFEVFRCELTASDSDSSTPSKLSAVTPRPDIGVLKRTRKPTLFSTAKKSRRGGAVMSPSSSASAAAAVAVALYMLWHWGLAHTLALGSWHGRIRFYPGEVK